MVCIRYHRGAIPLGIDCNLSSQTRNFCVNLVVLLILHSNVEAKFHGSLIFYTSNIFNQPVRFFLQAFKRLGYLIYVCHSCIARNQVDIFLVYPFQKIENCNCMCDFMSHTAERNESLIEDSGRILLTTRQPSGEERIYLI